MRDRETRSPVVQTKPDSRQQCFEEEHERTTQNSNAYQLLQQKRKTRGQEYRKLRREEKYIHKKKLLCEKYIN
jgi:hypothetical protein